MRFGQLKNWFGRAIKICLAAALIGGPVLAMIVALSSNHSTIQPPEQVGVDSDDSAVVPEANATGAERSRSAIYEVATAPSSGSFEMETGDARSVAVGERLANNEHRSLGEIGMSISLLGEEPVYNQWQTFRVEWFVPQSGDPECHAFRGEVIPAGDIRVDITIDDYSVQIGRSVFGVQQVSYVGWVNDLPDDQLLVFESAPATEDPDVYWEAYESFVHDGSPGRFRQHRVVDKNGPNGAWVSEYWTELLIARDGKCYYVYMLDADQAKSTGVLEYNADFYPAEINNAYLNSLDFLQVIGVASGMHSLASLQRFRRPTMEFQVKVVPA